MNLDKHLEEVWRWKEKAYEETKGMTMRERIERIRSNAERLLSSSGLRLPFLRRETKTGKKGTGYFLIYDNLGSESGLEIPLICLNPLYSLASGV